MNFRRLHSFLILIATFTPFASAQIQKGSAKQVIYLNMVGGMSSFETFDPKAEPEELAGPYKGIETKIPDCQISSLLPKTAEILDRCVILRNVEGGLTHVTEDAQYFRLTGYQRRTTVTHPDIGSWISWQQQGKRPYFRISEKPFTDSAFFPDAVCEPIVIPYPGMITKLNPSSENWEARGQLLTLLNSDAPQRRDKSSSTVSFLSNETAKDALDWDDEPDDLKAKYGDHDFGKCCLLARRLVEKSDAIFVEVTLPGWDVEDGEFFDGTAKLCGQLDDGFSALILDLEERNLLETTLVVIATDMGRRNIQDNRREFWARASCAVLAGGGVEGGKVIGSITNKGRMVEEGRVTARAFNAIIARAMGVDPFKKAFSPNRRPFSIADPREIKNGLPDVFKNP